MTEEAQIRGKKAMVTASSGVAALVADGHTIHSVTGLSSGKAGMKCWAKFDQERGLAINEASFLRLDEFSMMPLPAIRCVSGCFSGIKKKLHAWDDGLCAGAMAGVARMPFGGIAVLLSGDGLQLPPVEPEIKSSQAKQEREIHFQEPLDKMIVLELTECCRAQDERFAAIQRELREWLLSGSNHLSADFFRRLVAAGVLIITAPESELVSVAAQRLSEPRIDGEEEGEWTLCAPTHAILDAVARKIPVDRSFRWGAERGVSKAELYQNRVTFEFGRVEAEHGMITLPHICGERCDPKRAQAAWRQLAADPEVSRTTPKIQSFKIGDKVILNARVSKVKRLPNGFCTVVRGLHFKDGSDGELDGITIECDDGSWFCVGPSVVAKVMLDGIEVSEVALPLTSARERSVHRF
jgi:hypothetical protein